MRGPAHISVISRPRRSSRAGLFSASGETYLKHADFFPSRENPAIEFTSTRIVKHDDKTLHIEGTLAMAG